MRRTITPNAVAASEEHDFERTFLVIVLPKPIAKRVFSFVISIAALDTVRTEIPRPQRGRPTVLGPDKRRRLVALLDIGCSRRAAARCIGCSPTTINRTAMRDPEFAEEIARAETGLEVRLIENVSNAAKNDRYWRAASWLLERKYPDEYAPRAPQLYTPEQVIQLLVASLDTVREEIAEPQRNRIIQKLGALLLLELDPPDLSPATPGSADTSPKRASAPS